MKYIFIALLALPINAAVAAESSTKPGESQVKSAEVKPISNELTVKVKGMVCAFCAQGIEKSFKAQDEVESIFVSLEKKVVKLKFKDGKALSNDRVKEILKDAGYEVDSGS